MADLVLESKSADSAKSSRNTMQLLIAPQDKLSSSVSYTLCLSLLQFRSVLFSTFENIVHMLPVFHYNEERKDREKAEVLIAKDVPCPGACCCWARTLDDNSYPTSRQE